MTRLTIFNAEEIRAFDKPPRFSAEQRAIYFTLTPKLLTLLKKLKTSTNKVCVVLQWGYFRATGRFFSCKDFRSSDIEYIARQLNLLVTNIKLDDYHLKRKISREHEKRILKLLGFKPFTAKSKQLLEAQISCLVEKQMQPRAMIYYLASQLHQQKIEILTYYSFVETITHAYNTFEEQLLQKIQQQITPAQHMKLEALINEKENLTDKLKITGWKNLNQSLHTKAVQAQLEQFNFIKDYFVLVQPLLEALQLSSPASEYYALWLKKAKASQLKQFPCREKIYLYLLAFIQHQFYHQQDTLVDILLKTVQSMRNQALKNSLRAEQTKRTEKVKLIHSLAEQQESLETMINEITDIVNATTLADSDKVKKIKSLLEQRQQKLATSDKPIMTVKQMLQKIIEEGDYHDFLEALSGKLMRRVAGIIIAVDFDRTTSYLPLLQAIDYFKHQKGRIDENAPVDYLQIPSKKILYDENGKIKPGLYKALFCLEIVSAIKSGKLNLGHSYRYKAIQAYLIPAERWHAERDQLLALAGLTDFAEVDPVLNNLKRSLEEKYQHVNQRIQANLNLYIHFNTEGRFILETPKLEKNNTERVAELLTEAGLFPVITILSDINEATHFLQAFKHYSVKHHKLKPDLQTVLAGVLAHGCNIGVNKIAKLSKGINENTLNQVATWFFTLKNIQEANYKIIQLMNKLTLTSVFKYNPLITHTASDGQKMNVAVDSLLASYSFKYFGKDKGVSIYTFIDDKQSLFYSSVISAAEREAAYVMDGLLYNDVVKSTIHSTDMHGFTETIFAATHFMGTSFAPRLKQLNHQYIYGFSAKQTYEKRGYKIVPSRTINTKLIKENWDDILRFMVTIKLKEATASQLFKRLSSYAKDHPLYKALKEFGRLIKSQFVLTYIDDVQLRQRMEQQLNRVELANKFSKAVFFANNQAFKSGVQEEQEISTACKTLIQNAIVLWNYLYLSQMLMKQNSIEERTSLLNIIRNGSMLTWRHVNMQGEYDFTKSAANEMQFDLGKILTLDLERLH